MKQQGDPQAKFDPQAFTWLGSLSSFADDAYMLVVNSTHAAKTVDDLRNPGISALIGADVPGDESRLDQTLIEAHKKLNRKGRKALPQRSQSKLKGSPLRSLRKSSAPSAVMVLET